MTIDRSRVKSAGIPVAAAAMLLWASSAALAKDIKVTLTGTEETPPVATSAKGEGTISVGKDKSVKGTLHTSGIEGIAAHIHIGPPGQSGPPIITLTKGADGTWTVPDVHSADHKSGEIRAQLKP